MTRPTQIKRPGARRRLATIQDIAADLGLSAMTVSRALNDHPDVKDETRKRIQQRARELNYRPNRWARSLVTRESKMIGIVIPEITHTFFSEITGGVEDVLEGRGYTLMLCNSAGNPARERVEIDRLVGSRADGLIVASSFPEAEPELFRNLQAEGVPFVLIDRFFRDLDCARVRTDDHAALKLVAEHVIGLGHRRIAFVGGPPVSVAALRQEGFRAALAEAGIELPDEYVADGDFTPQRGLEAGRKLLSLSRPPTAICAVNDPCGMGVIRACREAGLDVPGDISVTGVGSVEGEFLPSPFMTTTTWSRFEMGRQAATILLDQITGPDPRLSTEAVIDPTLVVRCSTAPPRSA